MKMKKALAWLVAVTMLLTAFSGLTLTASAATLSTQTLTMAQMDGLYKTQGRVEQLTNADTGAKVLCMDMSTSGFEFYYYGEGALSLNASITSGGGTTYFSTIIDGEYTRLKVSTTAGTYTETTVTLATSLPEGYHHVEFYKQNEAKASRVNVNAVTLTGYLLEKPVEDPVTIEVVGDSISGGSDVYISEEQYNSGQSGWDAHQNGLESYGYKAGELIGANTRILQASGYGLVAGWNGDTSTNIPSIYQAADYFRYPDRAYAFDPPADIVVVNLGTNDYAGGVPSSAFQNTAESFSQTIRSYNPGSKIVWCTGMRASYYKDEMQAVVASLGGAENGYYFCELPQGASAGTHPNADEHTAAAQVLAEFLKANCLPEGYATVASTASLKAKIDAAQSAPFTSGALTEAIEAAQMELTIGTTDEFRLGSRMDAIEAALSGKTAGASFMPNAKHSTYDTEPNSGYNHVVVPSYNSDGSVKLVKSGTTSYWPRVDTAFGYAWNVKATPYMRVELAGTAKWNAQIHYADANGVLHDVVMSKEGNGDQDFQATATRQTVTVDLGSAVLKQGHANAEDIVYVQYVRFYVVGVNGVYVTLYDCSLTENNGTTWDGASDEASYISSANTIYVRENGATLSGAIPSGAKAYTETGVNSFTLSDVTMSGATTAFTVNSNVTVKLVGTNTVTADSLFSGGAATYIGTGVLMNGNTVVMRKGDVVPDTYNRVDSSDIRAMMNHCAGISLLDAKDIEIADTEGNGSLDTRDVRRYLDTVVAS